MKTKKNYFISQMFHRLLVPSMFSSLGFALADVADALVLGQKMGATGLAAISLNLPLFMLINLFMDGLGIGGSVRFSQFIGEGDSDEAVQCFNRTWLSTLAVGLIIAFVVNVFQEKFLILFGTTAMNRELYEASKNYMCIIAFGAPLLMLNIVFSNFLRNDNNANRATIGFLVGNTVDIVLNLVFVGLLDLGTTGAAFATVIGSFVAICIYMPGIIGKKAGLIKIELPKLDLREIIDCFKTGFSTSIQHLFQFLFLLIVNRILRQIAGEGGVAVFDVVYSISFFIIYTYNGIAEAAQPLISTFSGENIEDDCRCVLQLSKKYGLGLGAIVAVMLFIFAEAVSSMFGVPSELHPLSVHAIRIYCAGFAFVGLNIIYEKYYQSKENIKLAYFIALMRGSVVLVPCLVFCAGFGIKTIWLLFPLTELITLILFYIFRSCNKVSEGQFDTNRILRVIVENDSEDIVNLLDKSMGFCEGWGASAEQKYMVTLVIEEICTSILRNAMEHVTDGKIRVTLLVFESGEFVLNILDNAVVFNPFSLNTKKTEEDSEFDIDEISMMLIKNKTKKFMYRRNNGFNSLVVRI